MKTGKRKKAGLDMEIKSTNILIFMETIQNLFLNNLFG
jgi:hypothetical protein